MPIISTIDARTPQGRVLILSIYAILIAGAITVVYPFLLMLGVSITSAPDFRDYRIIPQYLYNDNVLFVKYLDEKYERRAIFSEVRSDFGFQSVEPRMAVDEIDVTAFDPNAHRRLVYEWRDFKESKDVPVRFKTGVFINAWIGGELQYLFHDWLRARYDNDIRRLNRELGLREDAIEDITPPITDGGGHSFRYTAGERAFVAAWEVFLQEQDARYIHVWNADSLYQHYLERIYATAQAINAAWGTSHASLFDIRLPLTPPQGPERLDWEHFVKQRYPLRFIQLGRNAQEREALALSYRDFLAREYGSITAYNQLHGLDLSSFDQAPFDHEEPQDDFQFNDWKAFVAQAVPVEQMVIIRDRTLWSDFLRKRFATIGALNNVTDGSHASFDEVPMPRRADHLLDFHENRSSIRLRFVGINYYIVAAYMVTKGWAFFNTLILVTATIATQLTIMPMAAFALSRFRLRYAHRILLFLLATMAFPAEVAMIPNFLLLKELSLLNTYWALILPGVASGFGIFLLKGFFDSLPQELYEAGVIEGANELQLFWMVTLPMSKPILAVIALGAFGAAYGGFMWAYLICQDQSMWTIMVWLFDFQSRHSPPFQVMAALVLAGIPTLLVFVFCQKIIMRGIIVPTFK